ncbi:MAG: phage holin family protein [Cetobacterium sp.]
MHLKILRDFGGGFLEPFIEVPLVYFVFTIMTSLLGGIDEAVVALMCLLLLDCLACVLAKERSNGGLMGGCLKVIIVVILGALMDRVLPLGENPILSVRTGVIYGYGYNLCVSIINTLAMDPNFYIPKKILDILSKGSNEK